MRLLVQAQFQLRLEQRLRLYHFARLLVPALVFELDVTVGREAYEHRFRERVIAAILGVPEVVREVKRRAVAKIPEHQVAAAVR